jgi:hypothetical protein
MARRGSNIIAAITNKTNIHIENEPFGKIYQKAHLCS